jgi:hypothetical protein
MDNVATLTVVPPTKKFDTDSKLFQRPLRFLDLNLEPTVRQQEWTGMIKQDFHVARFELSDTTIKSGQKNTSYGKLLVRPTYHFGSGALWLSMRTS